MNRKLTVDWAAFGQAIRAQAVIDATNITAIHHGLGLSHARMVNAAQGKPVGTEIFLTLCHWMQVDPLHFARSEEATPTQSERERTKR